MSNDMREAFERDHAKYVAEWSEQEFPITEAEHDAYKAGYGDGYQAATAAAEEKYLPVLEKLVEALKLAEYEFNAIRARDGAPQHIDWFQGRPMQTSSCTHEWWDEMTNKCSEALALAVPLMGGGHG